MIFVRLNGEYVPGSPYRVFVGQQKADPALVNAYGDGLVKGQTGQFHRKDIYYISLHTEAQNCYVHMIYSSNIL